ncbi:MAG TPA: trypsin-like peptidase domain-containing protein [Thermomicrobiales bacterium]|nr:trypsin-like peptidase domain-containing protein [Thermomicrobiales bacterium]
MNYPNEPGACMIKRTARKAAVGLQVGAMAVGLSGLLAIAGGAPLDVLAQTTTGPTAVNLCATAEHTPITPAEFMTVADVAAKVDPAVITVTNMQANQGGMGGQTITIPGMPGQGDIPSFPGQGDVPSFPGQSGDMPSQGDVPNFPGQSGSMPGQSNQPAFPGGGNGQAQPVGVGSGFIIDEQGHAITNAHVVDGADQLSVDLFDGTTVPATVVGKDDLLDIAVIKLDLPAGTKVPGVAKLGDSSVVRPGDQVVAIGSALGEFTNTVTEGTVNAVDRGLDGYGFDKLIQHDAEIWHGNSGGPLINLRGEVIGVNAAGLGGSGMSADIQPASIGFAIESNAVCTVADQLLETGKVAWPYLGIEAQPADTGNGQQVVSVVPNGPAAQAGLQPGDVIVGFNGTTLNNQHTLMGALFGEKPGEAATVTVQRNGADQTFNVTLGERPAATQ